MPTNQFSDARVVASPAVEFPMRGTRLGGLSGALTPWIHAIAAILFLFAGLAEAGTLKNDPTQDAIIRQILGELQVVPAIRMTLHKQLEQEKVAHPKLPSSTWKEVERLIEGPALENDLIDAWRGAYSSQDLRQILTFIKTSAGKKFLQEQSKIQQRMGAASGLQGLSIYTTLQRLHPDVYPRSGQLEAQMQVLLQQLRSR